MTEKKLTIKKSTSTKKKVAGIKTKKKSETISKPRKKITLSKPKEIEGLQEEIECKYGSTGTLTTEVAYLYLDRDYSTTELFRWLNKYFTYPWTIAKSVYSEVKRLQAYKDKMLLVDLELVENTYIVIVPRGNIDDTQIHITCMDEEKFLKMIK